MSSTKIEWADVVWNPITGCTPVSEGCQNCYAKRMANRLAGRFGYPQYIPFSVTEHVDKYIDPGSWRKPKRIFVCSMGDLFHEKVKKEWIDMVFFVMKNCLQHTFIILTKRPQNIEPMLYDSNILGGGDYLPNVHLGVSVENQKRADERIPILLQIPAATRFVSIEPMLGPIRLNGFIFNEHRGPDPFETQDDFYQRCNERLDWVILGGESGPGARPMHPDWVRSVRDQCIKAGIPFFFKQWGEWMPKEIMWAGKPEITMCKVGKKAAGRLLDEKAWNEMS